MSQGDQRVRRPPRILRVNTVPMPLSTPPTSPGVRMDQKVLGLPLPLHRNTPSPIHTPPLLSSNSQQIVYLYNVRSTDEERQRLVHNDEFPRMAVYILGLMSTCIAFVVLIIQILMIVNKSYMSEYGIGIWTGLCFGISGIMGIFSAHKTTTCTVTTSLVLNMLAMCFFAPTLIAFSSLGLCDALNKSEPTNIVCSSLLILFSALHCFSSLATVTLSFRFRCITRIRIRQAEIDHEMVPRNHRHDIPVTRGSILQQYGISKQQSREFVEPRNGYHSRRGSEKFQRFFSAIDEDECI